MLISPVIEINTPQERERDLRDRERKERDTHKNIVKVLLED